MKKSGFLQKQKNTVDTYRQATKDTYIQFMVDTLSVTLNDPNVMGKDTFGKRRLTKVIEAWMETYDQLVAAISDCDEADYYQVKMDERLKQIFGADAVEPFAQRYPWLKKPK